MQNIFRILALLLCFPFIAAPSRAGDQRGSVDFRFDLSGQAQGEEVRLWIPYPVTDAAQEISEVKIGGDYAESAVYTDREHGTPMLHARWPREAASRKLTFSFTAERNKIGRSDLAARETAWDPADYARWLAPTSLGPTDGAVKELADKITAGKATVAEKARAVYEWVCENTFRDPDTRGCGKGDVCKLLDRPGGKCADISSVFVALARAAGVPSREIFGLRLGQKDGDDLTGSYHCWAEFYLPGTGWVAADPADVRKAMLKDNLKNDDPKAAELRERFWGGLDAARIKVGLGRDLDLSPKQAAGPLNYLMYPYAEVGGKPVDWLDPKTFVYSVTFRER